MRTSAKEKSNNILALVVTCLFLILAGLSQFWLLSETIHSSQLAIVSGLAVGAVFYGGVRQILPVGLGYLCLSAYTISATTFIHGLYIVLLTAALTIQTCSIFFSYKQFSKQPNPLANYQNFVAFVFICALACLFTSILLSTISSAFMTGLAIDPYNILDLALSQLSGIILLSPIVIALKETDFRSLQRPSYLELLAWLTALTLCASLMKQEGLAIIFSFCILIIWSALRFSLIGCASTIAACSLLAIPALSMEPSNSGMSWVANNQYAIGWLLFCSANLYFSVLLKEKQKTELELEEIVTQRTLDLSLANQELKDEIFVRENAEKAQRNASKRYRALVETAGIPIIVLDRTSCIKQWNRAAESSFGYSRDEIINKNFIDHFIPESRRDELAWKLTRIAESGVHQDSIEVETVSEDQSIQTMLWNINLLPGTGDTPNQKQFLLIGQNISDIRKTQDQLHYLAHFDPLTDCANRRLFEARCAQAIESAIRHKHHIALIGLDIDHFKRINDTLGHDAGDSFLVELSQRLKQCVRKEDTIARLGGDEFAVLLANVKGQEGAERVARNMLEKITQPITLKNSELIITSSVGITLCPDDGTHYPDLLKNADMAMYRAKKAGRNNIQFYSPEMNEEMQRQLRIEQDLRTALKDNQFQLYYQPIIDIENSEVVALEALLRWNHPEEGVLRPNEFLHVAEQSGIVYEIGEWALRQACHDGKTVHSFSVNPVQIAFNLSNRQYHHPNLLASIKKVCSETGFNPHDLILEMSENTITYNSDRSIKVLQELHNLGVSLTIDGFGTGLSSLRQIKQIPIDIIKIDRSFVSGIPEESNDMTITETLLTVATQMDLQTFATGVENRDQEAFLKVSGCRYAQGYLYSAPLPFDKLRDLFATIREGKILDNGDQIFLPFHETKSD